MEQFRFVLGGVQLTVCFRTVRQPMLPTRSSGRFQSGSQVPTARSRFYEALPNDPDELIGDEESANARQENKKGCCGVSNPAEQERCARPRHPIAVPRTQNGIDQPNCQKQ